ncbi:hypothetical protein GOODEAATRI_012018 [Goodea atripinnis]|uniref:Uncharacterized protein n=1 Tax=Goodea atripinnis TaxID=208336 RepID=A0ABV0MH45_9TELE
MDKRGEHLSWLCMFWMLGGLYASFTAWGIIPHYGNTVKAPINKTLSHYVDTQCWGFTIGTQFQMHSWRLFMFVCLFPALAALIGIVFMPESPPHRTLPIQRENGNDTGTFTSGRSGRSVQLLGPYN